MSSIHARLRSELIGKTFEAEEIKSEMLLAERPPSDARADFEAASRYAYELIRSLIELGYYQEGQWLGPTK